MIEPNECYPIAFETSSRRHKQTPEMLPSLALVHVGSIWIDTEILKFSKGISMMVAVLLAMSGHFVGSKDGPNGKQSTKTCEARNSFFLGLLSTGESYHKNHHDRPMRCNMAMQYGQVDLGFLFIKALSVVHLAKYDINLNS